MWDRTALRSKDCSALGLSPRRPFDTILVDDTSRLSRNQAEAMTIVEKLKFAGLRMYFFHRKVSTPFRNKPTCNDLPRSNGLSV